MKTLDILGKKIRLAWRGRIAITVLLAAFLAVAGLLCAPAFAQDADSGNIAAVNKPADARPPGSTVTSDRETSEPGATSKLTSEANPAVATTAVTGSKAYSVDSLPLSVILAWFFAVLVAITAGVAFYLRFHSVMVVKKTLSRIRVDQIMTKTLLMRHERRFRSLLDNASDGIFTLSNLGTVETFNRAAVEIFGYSPEEVVGRNFSMLLPEDEAKSYRQELRQFSETKQGKIIDSGPRETIGPILPRSDSAEVFATVRAKSTAGHLLFQLNLFLRVYLLDL